MAQPTREALSEIERQKPVTKQDVLKLILQFEVPPFFLRRNLRYPGSKWPREYLLGFIGDRGGGKSASCAVVSVTDCMIIGKTVFSNMHVKVDIAIDDEIARKYGLNSGGTVRFESQNLEKDALLKMDERYKGGAFLIEEINVQYSNVRRFMSNTNVDFNEVAQQLRHWETPLIYNVIDEMFIDPQLRRLTDIFVKTYDTAFDVDNLLKGKPIGQDFNWTIYPNTGYLCGEQNKYERTHKPLTNVFFHFTPWHGIYETIGTAQSQGIYSMSTKEKNRTIQAQFTLESEANPNSKWQWLEEKALQLKRSGRTELEPWELAARLGKPLTDELRQAMMMYGIHYDRSIQMYRVEDFNL